MCQSCRILQQQRIKRITALQSEYVLISEMTVNRYSKFYFIVNKLRGEPCSGICLIYRQKITL